MRGEPRPNFDAPGIVLGGKVDVHAVPASLPGYGISDATTHMAKYCAAPP